MKEELIALNNYEEFVNIKEGKRHFYGGNQNWFQDKKYKKAGCGAVACANITAFLAAKNNLESLYKYNDFSKDNFVKHMEEVGQFAVPEDNIGILKPKILLADLQSFALSRGIIFNGFIMYFDEGQDLISKFIKDFLKENIPLALLIHRNDVIPEFSWHWMTITKYYKNEFYSYVNVSSWGERRILKLEDILSYSSFGAVVAIANK